MRISLFSLSLFCSCQWKQVQREREDVPSARNIMISSTSRQSRSTTEHDRRELRERDREKERARKCEFRYSLLGRTSAAVWDPCDPPLLHTIQRVHSERRTKWMSKNKWSIIGRACQRKSTCTRPGVEQEKKRRSRRRRRCRRRRRRERPARRRRRKKEKETKQEKKKRQNRFSLWDDNVVVVE